MLKINLTSKMREYLRQQMVFTDFELELVLKRRKREIQARINQLQEELRRIDIELLEVLGSKE